MVYTILWANTKFDGAQCGPCLHHLHENNKIPPMFGDDIFMLPLKCIHSDSQVCFATYIHTYIDIFISDTTELIRWHTHGSCKYLQ